jgi:hypothetical protein
MTKTRTIPTTRRLARLLAVAAWIIGGALLSGSAHAQRPPSDSLATGALTIQSSAPNATVALHGSSELLGEAPLDLGPEWVGRYRVMMSAPGYAAARGALELPGQGMAPSLRSDPPGLSGRSLLHALYFPGVSALLSHRTTRGTAFLIAGTGGLGAVVRDHLEYRSKRKEGDVETQERAKDFQYARNRWILYTAGVWGLSALDHLTTARVDLVTTTPTGITIGSPRLTRGGVIGHSILVPGGGQDFAGQDLKGSLWLGSVLLSGAACLTANESHRRIETKLARAETLLATATPGDIPDRQADVTHFSDLETRSSRLVNRLAIATIVIYAANVVDAGLLNLQASPNLGKVSLAPSIGPRTISLTYRF